MTDEKNTVCPLCFSNSFKQYDKVEQWSLLKCNSCNFIFTSPMPTEEKLKKFYSKEYFSDERHNEKFFSKDGSDKTENENEYLYRLKEVENYCSKRGSILDVGAARGGMLNVFKKYGWRVSGIEISEDASQKAKSLYGIELFCGTIENYVIENKFDVITFYQSLEHIPNPNEVMKKVFDLLDPGGILVIEVPNINTIENKISRKLKLRHYDIPRHVNHFSIGTLSTLFKRNGFEIIASENYWSIYQIRIYNFLRNTFQKKKQKQLNELPAETQVENFKNESTRRKKSIQTTLANTFPGWRITVIGRKPIDKN